MTTARPANPVELELKYRVRNGDAAERYLAAETLGRFKPASPVRPTQVEDRYVDTAGGDLAKAGFAARLGNNRAEEITTAIAEIAKICWYRLADVVAADSP